ncbi:MAG TPA: glycoside hydrolase family 2 TIM barrel-domain containing protein [Anaerolineae bacterium]|nr:glycoside hydrolase family 2 TIM barrel-domain containing protein [Anaerolineae bacterium]
MDKDIPASQPLLGVAADSLALSGEWRFAIDPGTVGVDEGWAEPSFDDSGWAVVSVPHTWGTMEEYANYDGVAWYRRSFALPAEVKDAYLRLRFDAVFYLARVWLNGEPLGEHEGGYTPFEFDVSGIAQPGAENLVAVRVDNVRAMDRIPAVLHRDRSFDWWNWGGIVRDVSLETTSRASIARQQVMAVPHLEGVDQADRATINTTVTVRNTSDETLDGALVADLFDDVNGNSVLETLQPVPVRLAPGESIEVLLTAEVTEPALWHFDHPNLYRWETSLLGADGQLLHKDLAVFGIRLIELKDARFYLNGEPVRLVGLTRHADSPWHGLAETVTMMAKDYDDLKTLNMVFSRPVHYPQHEFILDYCDRNGILLIPEVPAWQLKEYQMESEKMRALEKKQLREMIDAAFNHPSIWAWSVGNEYESKTPAGHEFTRELIDFVKSLDPTRPVSFASNHMEKDPELDATRFADFVMMNQYFGTWVGPKTGLAQALDDIHAAWPDKVVIVSEYGFDSHWNAYWGPLSSKLDPSEYYFIPEDTPEDSEEADVQRQRVITEQMAVFRSRPFVASAIFWTYQDYRSPSGFVMGVVDAERNRRGSWNVLREEYTPVSIKSVTVAPWDSNVCSAAVALRTRGPIEEDMPVYTLRGYSLHWAVMSPISEEIFAEGDLVLPTLEPGADWVGKVEWSDPGKEHMLVVGIVRPTGFTVLERRYDSHGAPYPGE